MITGPNPCYECNKDIKVPVFFIELYDGGRKMRMSKEEMIDEADSGYMGLHPLGSDCARKYRKNGVYIFKETCTIQPKGE